MSTPAPQTVTYAIRVSRKRPILSVSGLPASADAIRDCQIDAASAMSFSVVRTCAQACAARLRSRCLMAPIVSSSRSAMAGANAAALVESVLVDLPA